MQKIQEAHKRIAPYINYTPLIHSKHLSNNSTVKLKLESLQINDYKPTKKKDKKTNILKKEEDKKKKKK